MKITHALTLCTWNETMKHNVEKDNKKKAKKIQVKGKKGKRAGKRRRKRVDGEETVMLFTPWKHALGLYTKSKPINIGCCILETRRASSFRLESLPPLADTTCWHHLLPPLADTTYADAAHTDSTHADITLIDTLLPYAKLNDNTSHDATTPWTLSNDTMNAKQSVTPYAASHTLPSNIYTQYTLSLHILISHRQTIHTIHTVSSYTDTITNLCLAGTL